MSSLSEIHRTHHVNINYNNTPLDFSKVIREVPDSHAWSRVDLNGFSSSTVKSFDVVGTIVPVIDLADSNVVKLVKNACETWGAFQVINHGISTRLLEDVESECWRLFSLPTQHKLKVLRSPGEVSGYGLPQISPFFSKIMWHEGFTIIGSPKEHAYKLWPDGSTQFCDIIEEYQKGMKKLAEHLLSLMLKSLGISREEVDWAKATEINGAQTTLQLNSYPACPDPDRALGLVPHTDTSLLTILYQSSTSGLQIFRDGVGWVTLPPEPGALIVNVGDFLHILSNARFASALHRVIVNNARHRLSNAYFYAPPINAQITPFAKLIDGNHAPQYRSVSCSEYMGLKAKHLDKALSFIHL
ncbi:Gibberellin 3-beta-dioxygenase [Thalictrum thalictroides]|uniref:gibberellin 3beta-dioxygenase n=1 Tax=Thalictrum thalictroides TaxID=46969 RepID=A0A7J6X014_THATH|nr:Gibberellin 3-beta-dioxygenase [Thalictrum thalictroides]